MYILHFVRPNVQYFTETKHKLLKVFDPQLSETENCAINNIPRLWDCGKKRYMMYDSYK